MPRHGPRLDVALLFRFIQCFRFAVLPRGCESCVERLKRSFVIIRVPFDGNARFSISQSHVIPRVDAVQAQLARRRVERIFSDTMYPRRAEVDGRALVVDLGRGAPSAYSRFGFYYGHHCT